MPGSPLLSERALERAWNASAGFRTAGWKAAGHPGWAAGAAFRRAPIGHEGFTGTGVWMEPGEGKTYILLTNRIHPRHPGTDFGPVRAALLSGLPREMIVRDRWTHARPSSSRWSSTSSLLVFATRQYFASATKPQMLNQAAQRLTTLNGQPVRFVYVKDMVQSKEPPMDPSRLSDTNRRGASPDPRKGDSPDPTSFGHQPPAPVGGEGDAPVTRPPPCPPPHPPSRSRADRARAGRDARTPRTPLGRARIAAKPSSNREAKPGPGRARRPWASPPERGAGLPVGGESPPWPAPPRVQGQSPEPERPGLGTALQRMMVGSLQGGLLQPQRQPPQYGLPLLRHGGLGSRALRAEGPGARPEQLARAGSPEVLRQKGWVAIRFNVQKDGSITDLQVVRPSGIPSYDQSAIDALRSSNPLPPLPAEVTIPQIGGLFRFYYNMQRRVGATSLGWIV